ncbi:MAG: DUF4349 domain-containing protein [Candidatus Rokubacteria bacterium]|nr:DUF4349 domain-containing protein [Candidatus Rokubacteria bacterium]
MRLAPGPLVSLSGRIRALWHVALGLRGRRLAWAALAAAVILVLPFWLADRPPISSRGRPTTGRFVGRSAPEATLAPTDYRAAAPEGTPAVPWARRVLRQATFDIELGDVEGAIARLTELVEAAGGYVADTQTHADGAGVLRATVTAYVPPAAFSRTVRDLEPLGRITARRIAGQDVSEEFVDLEARVRNLERHEAQLLGFMARAQKVTDLLALETELARVRGEIERLTGRLRFLRARTEMAAVRVNLVRVGAAAPAEGLLARARERVREAFVAGWQAAFDVAVGLAALAAQGSPLAVPAGLGWALYRRLRRQPASPPPAVTA